MLVTIYMVGSMMIQEEMILIRKAMPMIVFQPRMRIPRRKRLSLIVTKSGLKWGMKYPRMWKLVRPFHPQMM